MIYEHICCHIDALILVVRDRCAPHHIEEGENRAAGPGEGGRGMSGGGG